MIGMIQVAEFQPVLAPQILSESHAVESGHRLVTRTLEHASIGGNCNISKGVYADAHVQNGLRVKIQNHASVFEGVALDDRVYINISCR